ncbi:MAG TPA: thiamine pyrophosphate-binding protein [Candidatus Sulfotelmatobacter sp.]|nr:thiamine pyrophosphate-binding protein [Candidatus Sulfotelmatobacter sp.]
MEAAEHLAHALRARGVTRVFGLEGGHIQPLWDHLARLGIAIVDVRDERAAVHMAHAHADLLGTVGVACVTAGPGVTNTVTAVANANVAGVPVVVIGGAAPTAQDHMGPLQGIPQVPMMTPITRFARTVRAAEHAVRELDLAFGAALGDRGERGAAYIEFPTDVLRADVPAPLVLDEFRVMRMPRRVAPDAAAVVEAVERLWTARRPVVVTGRGARGAGPEVRKLLDVLGALYLDTQDSRGLVPDEHPAVVGALRGAVMGEADVVLTVGRKLDYQLGYGSPAVFPHATFVRVADDVSEIADNRRGEPEVFATPALALSAIVAAAAGRTPAVDREWAAQMRVKHEERARAYDAKLASAPAGADGRMHPNRIFAAIRAVVDDDAIAIADGGDILSFARLGLTQRTYLDSGTFGCLGVGVPFAIAAALASPDRTVVSVNGDGAFGFNAIELDTAVRHNARAVFIVANNAAWNIERYDQELNYGGRIVGTELRDSDYAGLARALGAHGETVTDPAELEGALRRAIANAPALLDVKVTRDAVSSDGGKGLGYVPTYQPLSAWDEAERRRREPEHSLS